MVLDFVRDIGALYRSADIFVFPSLEEGAPLVTYEAAACGLPVITTPMGAASIVRHNREGLVIDPYDSASWIAAIRVFSREIPERRRSMRTAAVERAQSFHWSAVARRRRQQVLDRPRIPQNHISD